MPLFEVEEGVELYYEVSGNCDAPNKILCVMGWASCCKMGNWENQTDYFSHLPDFEVCIFDNRGSGFSSAPPGPYSMSLLANDALKIADHLGWQKFHLVGASMGGMISQRIAVTAPHRLQTLTLLCTRFDSGWWQSLPTFKALGIIARQHLEMFVLRDETSHIRHLLDLMFSAKFLEDTHSTGTSNREYLHKRLSEKKKQIPPVNVKGSMAQLTAIHGHQITEKDISIFKESDFNILVITGDNDLMVPHKHSLSIKSLLDHKAELFVIPGAGHGILEECKHEVNEKMKEFILANSTQK